MLRVPRRSAPLAIVLVATLGFACEEEVPSPSPTQVCLNRTAAENAGLCDTKVCVEKERVVRVDTRSSPGFSLSGLCPTAEELAQSGAKLENYALAYELHEPGSGMNLFLGFGGALCAEPVSAEALKRHFVGADAHSNDVPMSNGLKGECLTVLDPQDVTFVSTGEGRVHLRATVHFTKLQMYTVEPLCISSAPFRVPRGCRCEYGGATYDYVLDLNVPFPAYTP
jgi:hypothetical protein